MQGLGAHWIGPEIRASFLWGKAVGVPRDIFASPCATALNVCVQQVGPRVVRKHLVPTRADDGPIFNRRKCGSSGQCIVVCPQVIVAVTQVWQWALLQTKVMLVVFPSVASSTTIRRKTRRTLSVQNNGIDAPLPFIACHSRVAFVDVQPHSTAPCVLFDPNSRFIRLDGQCRSAFKPMGFPLVCGDFGGEPGMLEKHT